MDKMTTDLCRTLGRHLLNWGAAAVAVTALAACAMPSGVSTFTASECKQISKRAEAKINWARVPEIEIRARNGEYSPMVTRLQQGRPYVLRIRNRDDSLRIFRAQDFFERNAVIAVGVEGVRSEDTCIAAISIPARQSAEVRLVAVTDGTFEFEDNALLLPFAFSGGPSGAIVIDERRETAGIN
ncbi:MAG: hypothetical protein WD075_07730 [Rhodospirillales bacterium]